MFKQIKREWGLNTQFLYSPEIHNLISMIEPLRILDNQWTLQVTDKNVKFVGIGILQLVLGMNKISKPYMTVQRYKGLGEMNPEQLWETSLEIL